MNPQARAEELRRQIRRADDLYYNQGTPELSDAEYDALFGELRDLEATHPDLVKGDSPTQRVGAPLPAGSRFETAAHLEPMLSIESLQEPDQVREFEARVRRHLDLPDEPIRWLVEPKLDGVSANLLYEKGALVRGLSRGDGATGEDVTRNLRTIPSIPLHLGGPGPWPARVEVRGEVILSRGSFAALREHGETTTDTPFRNPRNAVAGTLKLLDPGTVRRRRLEFFAWGIGYLEGTDARRQGDLRDLCRTWGFQLAEPGETATTIDDVLAFHDRVEAQRADIAYEMDGIVAKVDALELQQKLGRTARAPRWVLAYKFAARKADTRVHAILSQVGRTGAITPVAELDPVELAGVTVRRASLHNWQLLRERDVREGDWVLVQRAGDVIPEVVEVYTDRRSADSKPPATPTTCPSCGAPPEQEGAHLYCVNLDCPAQLKARIVHLASRRALDIDRLGPKYVDQLVEAGILRAVEDVFTLDECGDALLALERWGAKSVERLTEEIRRAKAPPLARLLYGLGIRHVGEQTAKDLAAELGSLTALGAADADTLVAVDGVGPEVAASIQAFFALPANQRFLARTAEAGLAPENPPPRPATGPLAGRVFCFTGSMKELSRDDARALVEAHGGKASPSVTSRVTDVVIGERAGSKAKKAEDLGIRILTQEQFSALVGREADEATAT
ncbi:MAG: NAD-dependent DNA ligase LigA [Planctomycetota bacterium]